MNITLTYFTACFVGITECTHCVPRENKQAQVWVRKTAQEVQAYIF